MSTRIVVGDERRLFSEAIAETLKLVHDFEVVEVVDDSRELVPAVRRLLPSVTVLGSNAESGERPPLVGELRAAVPQCGIVVVGTGSTPGTSATGPGDHAPASGTYSFIPDNASLTRLVRTIRGLHASRTSVDAALIRQPDGAHRPLSEREREVLRLTADGAPVREIAAELILSPGTVRNLTSSAIKKLGGRNRFDAARIAGRRGWL